jgi:hypothetical protein
MTKASAQALCDTFNASPIFPPNETYNTGDPQLSDSDKDADGNCYGVQRVFSESTFSWEPVVL